MRLLNLLYLVLLPASAFSFLPIGKAFQYSRISSCESQRGQLLHRHSKEIVSLFEANNDESNSSREIISYSDDCFGLIFLSSAIAFQDYVFGGVFFILSLVGVISVNSYNLSSYQQKAPAAVSALTIAIISLGRSWLTNAIDFNFPEISSSTMPAEYLFCSISILNSFLRKKANLPLK
mmetsp:Transcript_11457/g.17602  ORF Transcript_11457/g.17602 Transcript_11457/m.17602 type:complete len:178 (+) Transcript_11457:104-637(+)